MNNPARRLHTIITGLQQQPKLRVDNAFAKVLNVEDENYSLLMKRIGLVFVLIDAIEQTVKRIEGINHDKYLLPVSNISAKMRGLHFGTQIQHSTVAQINDGTMAYLDMTAEYLTMHSPEPTMTEESREKILESIFSLWKEVENTTDLPNRLRQFIFDKLDLLRQAVEIYDISGVNPVKEASESIVGSMIFQNPEYKEQSQSSSILEKLFKCAVTAYCSIESINNVAALPESIKTIVGLLGISS